MKRFIITLFIIFPIISNAQSLGIERVKKLKKSVVRVFIKNQSSGTAFFINSDGLLISCWHVIDSAIKVDTITHTRVQSKQIIIELSDGTQYTVHVPSKFLQQNYFYAKVYDYVILKPDIKPKSKFSFLNLGNFKDINEGDVIFTDGYPLGIKQNFISEGLLSTKWTQHKKSISNHENLNIPRDVAWLDLTMNKGNSGGPIIKLGQNSEQDKVIGIADFILNPFAREASKIVKRSAKIEKHGPIVSKQGISLGRSVEFISNAIINNSIGVSGCISIDYVKDALKEYK